MPISKQKNWTHVRKLRSALRYDLLEALTALNDLYRTELRLMMNLFQPSVKLQRKVRVGSRVRRVYDAPQTHSAKSWPKTARIPSGSGR